MGDGGVCLPTGGRCDLFAVTLLNSTIPAQTPNVSLSIAHGSPVLFHSALYGAAFNRFNIATAEPRLAVGRILHVLRKRSGAKRLLLRCEREILTDKMPVFSSPAVRLDYAISFWMAA